MRDRPRVTAERILVIDDEREVGESVRRILGREHEVDLAASGPEALALIGANRYDVVLCDLLMPDMTGMELHALVSSRHPAVATRMVFMTGGAFSPDAQEFLKRIPNLRFEKPFDASALRDIVARVGD